MVARHKVAFAFASTVFLLLATTALAALATHRGRWWLADVLTVTACAIAPPVPRQPMTDAQTERVWIRVTDAMAQEAARAPAHD